MRRLLLGTALVAVVLGVGAHVLAGDSTEAARPAVVLVGGGWHLTVGTQCKDLTARNILWRKAGGTRYVVIRMERRTPSDAESQEAGIRIDKPRREGFLANLKLTRPSGFADGEVWSAWVELRNTGGKTIAVSEPAVIEGCSSG